MVTSKPEQFEALNAEPFGMEIFGPQEPSNETGIKRVPHENMQANIVQIYIDPKTIELSAALHGILNATKITADRFPNAIIKSIDVSNDYVRVETTGNESIAIPDNFSTRRLLIG